MKPIFFLLMLMTLTGSSYAQDTIMPLWPKDRIPNRIPSDQKEERVYTNILRIAKVQEPTIEVYLPSKSNANGKAVLIFPGGGYGILAYDWEGTDIAKFLNSKGVAGIVVKYRLPDDASQTHKENVPLIDAQRALRLVRGNAERFHIDTGQIGIIGFSAGGHLASTLGTQYDNKVYEPVDALDALSARPDFMSLGYPVISFIDPAKHSGSEQNLIGKNASEAMERKFSGELNVTADTPPTFLVHASDDHGVPVENSLLFYKALVAKGVPATLHVYPKGGHGFSLGLKDPQLRGWTERWWEWMEALD